MSLFVTLFPQMPLGSVTATSYSVGDMDLMNNARTKQQANNDSSMLCQKAIAVIKERGLAGTSFHCFSFCLLDPCPPPPTLLDAACLTSQHAAHNRQSTTKLAVAVPQFLFLRSCPFCLLSSLPCAGTSAPDECGHEDS